MEDQTFAAIMTIENQADYRLFFAAPELLAVVKKVVEYGENGALMVQTYNEAKSAIAKVEQDDPTS